jgi:hypothetical protein
VPDEEVAPAPPDKEGAAVPYQPYTVHAKVKSTNSIALKIVLLLVGAVGIATGVVITLVIAGLS